MKLFTYKRNGTTYQCVQTDKFKTRLISISFFADFKEDDITSRNLMFAMLKAKNKAFDTRKSQLRHLESLYDSLWYGQSQKHGTKHVNKLSMIIIDDRYTTQKTLFDDALKFINHSLFEPLFDEKALAEEKQFLKDFFKAEYANKHRYAHKRYATALMKNHPYRGSAQGVEERIDLVTLNMINESYQKMLHENHVFITLIGNFDCLNIEEKLNSALPINSMYSEKPMIFRHPFSFISDQKEDHDIKQTRLFVTLKSEVYYRDDDYFPMIVLNAMLGESSDSLLFKSIREESGLVYDISSSYSAYTGLITISCGINPQNIEQGKKLISKCIDNIQYGQFTDEDIMLAKTYLISGFKQSYDSLGSIASKALRSALFDVPFHEEKLQETIMEITREDLMKLSQKLTMIFNFEFGGQTDET